jgi:hypothetical protein
MTELSTEQTQDRYMHLIDQLLQCPNGQEPNILDQHPDLIDAGLVQAMTQVAAYFAHHDNQDGAKFLVHVARELAKQLGLYPQVDSTTGELSQPDVP